MNLFIDKLEKPKVCRRFVADISKLCGKRKDTIALNRVSKDKTNKVKNDCKKN